MGMFEAYSVCLQKYATFQGRARRSEYWYFLLCNIIIEALLTIVSYALAFSGVPVLITIGLALNTIYCLFILLPGLAVTIRRLHDTGHSGAHYFLGMIPLAGPIILLVYMCRDSIPGGNQYGPNPKEIVPDGPIHYNPGPGLQQGNKAAAGGGYAAGTPGAGRMLLRVACTAGPNAGAVATGETVYVGRDAGTCQLLFPNAPGVSRVHCMFHTDGQTIQVQDLRSSYGTFLANGLKLEPNTPSPIQSGSMVFIGSRNIAVSVELVSM